MSWFTDIFKKKTSLTGICRHHATYALAVFGEKYPVRIAGGVNHDFAHVQAQAYIDEKWQWLKVNYPDVVTGSRDSGFVEDTFISASDWFKMPLMIPANRGK